MRKIAEMPIKTRVFLVVMQCSMLIGLLGTILFVSAGTLDWMHAWALLSVYSVCFIITSLILFLKAPELMDERRKKHDNVKRWDKWLVRAFQAMYFPTFILSGLDRRWNWSKVAIGISIVALVLIVAFFVIATWSPLVNTHLETYIRIQTDRHHQVINTGPYSVVRHPTYIGLALFFIAIPLSLGSFVGLMPSAVAVVTLGIRSALEDKILLAELDGYRAYAQRVRYRWIPFVW